MATSIKRLLSTVFVFGLFTFGLLLCDEARGQMEEQPASGQVDRPFGKSRGDTISLLVQQNIKRDLELTQDQIDQIRVFKQQHNAIVQELMGGYRQQARDLKPEERQIFYRELNEKRKKSNEELEDNISQVLLPFQTERLEQIKVQFTLKGRGNDSASPILHPVFADKLGIDDEQKKRIREKLIEVKKQLEKDIAKLRHKASEEVLSELTSQQREIYDEILGEPLEELNQKDD